MLKQFMRVALIVVLLSSISILYGQSDLTTHIEELVNQSWPKDIQGLAIIAVQDGKTVYRSARGLANIELDVPMTPEMVFRIGSITKQFTAAAILLLEEQGKLKVEDTIDKYLPEYPSEQASIITIDHLLSHTSGVKNITEVPKYIDANDSRHWVTVSELIDYFKDYDLDFQPGEKYSYSNSGYMLLGAIIEAVSGKSYADFIQESIFDRLGMNNSHYDDYYKIIPNRISAYYETDEGIIHSEFMSMTRPYAAGGLLSTVDDLAIWDQALHSGKVLNETSYRKMTTNGTLNNGNKQIYGYGIFVSNNGLKTYDHGGGIGGFHSVIIHSETTNVENINKYFVAIISNFSDPKLLYRNKKNKMATDIIDLLNENR